MKKLKLFLSTFGLLLLALATPVSAFAATLSLSPATGNANKGCVFSVDILLDTQGAQTDGTDVILTYEPSKLTLATTDITIGKIYADYPGNSVDPQAGKISISGISSVSDAFNGKGTFATLKFKVSPTATGNTTVKFDFNPNDKTKTTDTNVVERGTIADVLTQVTDGSYTIGSGACGTGGTGTTPGVSPSPIVGQGGPLSTLPPGTNASASSIPTYTSLPKSGLLDNTIVLTSLGVGLVLLGILGLAIL